MELTKRANIKTITEQELESINRLVLENQGQAFSIIKKFETHCIAYSRICGVWTKDIADGLFGGIPKDIDRYKLHWSAYKKMPSGISVSSRYDILSDGRNKSNKSATVIKGYIVTINISSEYSKQYYYQNYSKDGLLFRDHLLNTRYDVLKFICENNSFLENFFCVTNDGILNDNVNECVNSVIRFSQCGFLPLDNIAQCYGFALALIEVMKCQQPNIGNHKIECRTYLGNDCITVAFTKDTTKTLKSW